ncbi:hypothetical protein Hanom_Chr00s000002g01600671 [Helianthus anomalus]
MHLREMAPKETFKDDCPTADAYIKNALFKTLSQHPSECQVIPEGALVLVGMSLLWRDWSLFDFVDPPRNAALRSADPMVGE